MIDLTDETVLKLLSDFADTVMALQPKGWQGELVLRIVRTPGSIVWYYLDIKDGGRQAMS